MTISARGRQIAILEALGETGWWVCHFFDGSTPAVVHRTDIHIHQEARQS